MSSQTPLTKLDIASLLAQPIQIPTFTNLDAPKTKNTETHPAKTPFLPVPKAGPDGIFDSRLLIHDQVQDVIDMIEQDTNELAQQIKDKKEQKLLQQGLVPPKVRVRLTKDGHDAVKMCQALEKKTGIGGL